MILLFMRGLVGKSMKQGAATTVYAAVHPSLKGKGGLYLNNCGIDSSSEFASKDENLEKLWKLTEELTKEKYPF
jgi:hypothetical protein